MNVILFGLVWLVLKFLDFYVICCCVLTWLCWTQHWNKWNSWHRMGQSWLWVSSYRLYVCHEVCSRRELLWWWIAAFWEHWVEPFGWSLELWPGWMFKLLYCCSVLLCESYDIFSDSVLNTRDANFMSGRVYILMEFVVLLFLSGCVC